MIKVTYETVGEKLKEAETTTIQIFDGRMWVRYNIPGKANSVVQQMRADGKTGVLSTRGAMLQTFHGKNEDEILEIVKKDIENGLYVAKKKGQEFKIQNLTLEKIDEKV